MKLKALSLFYITLLILSGVLFAHNGNPNSDDSLLINLEGEWKYIRSDGNISLFEIPDTQNNPHTQTIDSPVKIERLSNCNELWMWTTLPRFEVHGQSLFIGYVIDILEVYIDNKLIYSSGDFSIT